MIKLKNDSLSDNPNIIAKTLNDYFVNIGLNLTKNIEKSTKSYKHYMPTSNTNSFFLTPTDPAEIISVLKKFSYKKAAGPDNIPSKILKLDAVSLSPILSALINECFSTGVLPKTLKLARITTIFKVLGKTPF